MSTRTLFLTSAGALAFAVGSFATGMAVFMDRNAAIRERLESEGAGAITQREVVHAKRAAQQGSIAAGAFLVVSMVTFSRGVGTWIQNRKGESGEAAAHRR